MRIFDAEIRMSEYGKELGRFGLAKSSGLASFDLNTSRSTSWSQCLFSSTRGVQCTPQSHTNSRSSRWSHEDPKTEHHPSYGPYMGHIWASYSVSALLRMDWHCELPGSHCHTYAQSIEDSSQLPGFSKTAIWLDQTIFCAAWGHLPSFWVLGTLENTCNIFESGCCLAGWNRWEAERDSNRPIIHIKQSCPPWDAHSARIGACPQNLTCFKRCKASSCRKCSRYSSSRRLMDPIFRSSRAYQVDGNPISISSRLGISSVPPCP